LDYQFETTCPPDQVAAVFIEPLMSDGGLIVPPPGFLKALQERCRRHGIMIVLDEVKVGLGRSGLMHCFQHEGLAPDMVVFGKGIGGGLPLSAVVGPKAIMDHAPAFALLTTAGNPVAAAAGNAVLETIETEGLVDRARRVGKLFSDTLRALGAKHEIIGDVRGRGLAVGIELVKDRATRAPVPAITTAKIIYRGYEIGAAFTYVGLKANVLEFMPPLTLTEDEAEEGASIVDQAITDVLAGKVVDKDVASFLMWCGGNGTVLEKDTRGNAHLHRGAKTVLRGNRATGRKGQSLAERPGYVAGDRRRDGRLSRPYRQRQRDCGPCQRERPHDDDVLRLQWTGGHVAALRQGRTGAPRSSGVGWPAPTVSRISRRAADVQAESKRRRHLLRLERSGCRRDAGTRRTDRMVERQGRGQSRGVPAGQ